jgi:hypothetical protein
MGITRRQTPEVKFPFDDLQQAQPEIPGLGLSHFREFGVEPVFPKPIGWLNRPAMCNALKDARQRSLFCCSVMYAVPMRRRRLVGLQTNLRTDNGDIDNLLFHSEA